MTDTNTPADLRRILTMARTIAVVGLSPKSERPSHGVAAFLQAKGHRIIPVNPGHAGQVILGETVYASLSDIPPDVTVDMIDIFRTPDAVPGIVDEAIAVLPRLRSVWMQLGVSHHEAAVRAMDAGLDVVQDRCPKIEYPRVM
ncbi:CoA-binding protein [Paracoccus sp. p3-h83]|uniref:CoA-binding protein n=1 Tax=Paracoccus sp. p3-h83 TaxID=3342805 RepID=UPI0035B99BC8